MWDVFANFVIFIIIHQVGKRKISQAGRKPKMSDSYPNLPSPSQVERGLPLKKRGRPVKHALVIPIL